MRYKILTFSESRKAYPACTMTYITVCPQDGKEAAFCRCRRCVSITLMSRRPTRSRAPLSALPCTVRSEFLLAPGGSVTDCCQSVNGSLVGHAGHTHASLCIQQTGVLPGTSPSPQLLTGLHRPPKACVLSLKGSFWSAAVLVTSKESGRGLPVEGFLWRMNLLNFF